MSLPPATLRDLTVKAEAPNSLAIAYVGNLHVFQRRPEPGRPISLSMRPEELAGREELLDEIDARLLRAEQRNLRIVALHGLGGVGKSSVALEYAHRFAQRWEHSAGVVWQFHAERTEILTDGFSRLAARLGIAAQPDTDDLVRAVHAILAAATAPDRKSVV